MSFNVDQLFSPADIAGVLKSTFFRNGNIFGTLISPAQPNVTSLGVLTSLTMGGNINLQNNNIINGGSIAGTISTATQPNITSLGSLNALNVSGVSMFDDNVIIDLDDIEAFTVRKNNNGNDIFTVDTENSRVTVNGDLVVSGNDIS